MNKKYELIKDEYGLTRIRALKDFVLFTGEHVKKGDIGGLVESEDSLSQEGNCWAMECTDIYGKVSGNAVIKDEALIYGTVSGNAIVTDKAIVHGTVSGNAVVGDHSNIFGTVSDNATVKGQAFVCGRVSGNAVIKDYAIINGVVSGNAIVKNRGFIGTDATATGNAIVQADQAIIYGIVETDLLGTKDWEGALYAELGIVPENGKAIVYTKVCNTEDPNVFSETSSNQVYELGKETTGTDEFYFTSLEFINEWDGDTILECEVDIEDVLTVQDNTVRAKKCKVIRIVKEEQQFYHFS